MRTRAKIIVALAGAALAALAVYWFCLPQSTGPVYRGKTLEQWEFEYYRRLHDDASSPSSDDEALDVLHAMCISNTPALNAMVANLDYDPLPHARKFRARWGWLPRRVFFWLINSPLQDRRNIRADVARTVLYSMGPDAAPALPALEKLTASTNDMISRDAIMVMSSLGTNALPNLTRIMLDVKHPRAADAEQLLLDLHESGSNIVSAAQALQAAVHGADPQLAARAQKILNRLEAPPATNAVTRTNSSSP